MSKTSFLYLVFSSTRCSMGSFIRFMTGNFYNHVSVSLDPKLANMYSFARRYKSVPFYGGFVQESCLRYQSRDTAAVKICAIELDDGQYDLVKKLLDDMSQSDKHYIYNTISAAVNVFHRKVHINDAYTCVEFAVKLLERLGIKDISADRFYTIKQLEDIFEEHIIYKGDFPCWCDDADWGNDVYNRHTGFIKGSRQTVSVHWDLLRRMLKRAC